MPLAIDASIAFKWFVAEADSEAALSLLDSDDALWAPDLLLTEVGNALWARLRSLPNGEAVTQEALVRLPRIFTSIAPAQELIARAAKIAFEIDHPIYDCVYLALVEREKIELITADARLQRNVRGTRFETMVRTP
ncbi:type II toxin-antitoxin system VapC family toxin [Sphingoaurantiacus capsulatus]|uniref:Ribonuclease VapC n=1 Tax=Sphingoaurantiacus capsulatus TaxID=1771310 RepID=A0ABV7X5L2_9SPHN